MGFTVDFKYKVYGCGKKRSGYGSSPEENEFDVSTDHGLRGKYTFYSEDQPDDWKYRIKYRILSSLGDYDDFSGIAINIYCVQREEIDFSDDETDSDDEIEYNFDYTEKQGDQKFNYETLYENKLKPYEYC